MSCLLLQQEATVAAARGMNLAQANAKGLSLLMSKTKGSVASQKKKGKAYNACIKNGKRRGDFKWPERLFQQKGTTDSGGYINVRKLRDTHFGTKYPFDCDLKDFRGTGLCKTIKEYRGNQDKCSTCSWKHKNNDMPTTKKPLVVHTMTGGVVGGSSGKVTLEVFCGRLCADKDVKRCRHFYRVKHPDSKSRRRRLLGMKREEAECRL